MLHNPSRISRHVFPARDDAQEHAGLGRQSVRVLRRVVDLLLDGKPVLAEGQKPSIGCNIKWR